MRMNKPTVKPPKMFSDMEKFPEELGTSIPLAMHLEGHYRRELEELEQAKLTRRAAELFPQHVGGMVHVDPYMTKGNSAQSVKYAQTLVNSMLPKLPLFADSTYTTMPARVAQTVSLPPVQPPTMALTKDVATSEQVNKLIDLLQGKTEKQLPSQGIVRPYHCDTPAGPKPIYVQRMNNG